MLDIETEKRIIELQKRAETKGIFTYTEFLNEDAVTFAEKRGGVAFGGCDFASRKIVRFGECNKTESYPLVLLKITLLGGKFAREITHRDVLGAVMNLGIERDKVGDIFVSERAFIVVHSTVELLVLNELKTISSNNVKVEKVESVPSEFAPKLVEKTFTVNGERADAVVSGVYNLAREKASELFAQERVLVNGAVVSKGAKLLKAGDVVVVRGKGKFVFDGENGTSKKGKTYVKVFIYS